ncbi:MAG: hypothetical protein ACLFR0_09455, partial [Alphaproteobacteria bacterium]
EDQPWLTIAKARKQDLEILHNMKMGSLEQAGIDDIGALEFMADHKDEAERVLTSHLAYLDQKEKDVPPPTPEQYRLMGIDPVTGAALPYIRYHVNPKRTLEIQCADGMAAQPLSNESIGAKFIVVELPKDITAPKLQKKLDKSGKDLVMAGLLSGERRLAAKAKVLPLWEESADNFYDDEITAAKKHFEDSGLEFPEDRSRLAIIKMEDNPKIGGMRGDGKYVDPNLQSIHVPFDKGRKLFLGMVSRKLGSLPERVTGLMLRSDDIKQPLDTGAIRLREMNEDGLTGREIEHSVTRILPLNMKKFMQAYHLLEEQGAVNIEDYDLKSCREAGFDDKAEMAQYIGVFNDPARYGYASRLDIYDSALAMFTKHRHKVMEAPEKYNLTIIDLKKSIKASELRNTMAYFDLYNRPKASIAQSATSEKKLAKNKDAYLYGGAYAGQHPEYDA